MESRIDRVQDRIHLLKHFEIRKAEGLVSPKRKESVTFLISRFLSRMAVLIPIDLNDKFGAVTDEVEHIAVEG